MIYKLRVIFDTEEDIIRDIAIKSDDTLEDLHNAIVNAFGFDGHEMASFYTCDDKWNQEDEIPLFDTGDVAGEMRTMKDFAINDLLYSKATKIIYVYDFMNMYTFLVELLAEEENNNLESYPLVFFATGMLTAAQMEGFPEVDDENFFDDFEDDLDEDDLDIFGDEDQNYEDFGYEENWN
ncbi:MAG: IS1096 element passenger TnpR family protein [Flavobacterium sp.]|jgi:hypothetical protein